MHKCHLLIRSTRLPVATQSGRQPQMPAERRHCHLYRQSQPSVMVILRRHGGMQGTLSHYRHFSHRGERHRRTHTVAAATRGWGRFQPVSRLTWRAHSFIPPAQRMKPHQKGEKAYYCRAARAHRLADFRRWCADCCPGYVILRGSGRSANALMSCLMRNKTARVVWIVMDLVSKLERPAYVKSCQACPCRWYLAEGVQKCQSPA